MILTVIIINNTKKVGYWDTSGVAKKLHKVF